MPLLFYIRHGETDWNVESRLQGQHDIPINARGRTQACHSGAILGELLARDGLDAASLDFVASPLGRARQTMQLVRASLGLEENAYRVDPRLAEVSFGAWEGYTSEELRTRFPDLNAAREADKWGFTPPQGESYATASLRMREWYDAITHDTVAVAHGGTLRGLVVQLGIATWDDAPFLEVSQGVVYAIAPGSIARYT